MRARALSLSLSFSVQCAWITLKCSRQWTNTTINTIYFIMCAMCIIYKQWSISHVQIYSPLLLKRVNSLLGKSVWIFALSRMFSFYTCLYMYASWKVFVVYPFVAKITTVIKFNPLCPELYPHIDANLLLTISSFMYQFLFDLMWVLPSFK